MTEKTIHKYPLSLQREQKIDTPFDWRFLTVQMQNGVITIWAEVIPDGKTIARPVYIVGTGHDVPKFGSYRGTVQDGSFVWHVYA